MVKGPIENMVSDIKLTTEQITTVHKDLAERMFGGIMYLTNNGYGITNFDMNVKNEPVDGILDKNGNADMTIRIQIEKDK